MPRPLFEIILAAAAGAAVVACVNRTLRKLIMPLREDLDALKQSFGTLASGVDDYIAKHGGDTGALQAALDQQITANKALTDANAALTGNLAADDAKVVAANQAAADAKSAQDALQQAVDAADADIQGLKSQADTVSAKLQPVQAPTP